MRGTRIERRTKLIVKNKEIIKDLAKKSGISLVYLAKEMNISREALYQRIRGEVLFNTSDLKVLSEVFNLSNKEIYDLFIK